MKICWDTLENVWITENGVFRKGTACYVEAICVECKEPFLAKKSVSTNVFCSNKCSNKGINNPFYNKKHTEGSIRKMSENHAGGIVSDSTKEKFSKMFSGSGNPNYKGGVKEKGLPLFDTYAKQISYAEEVRDVHIDGLKLLEVKCVYCGRWFVPKIQAVWDRKKALLHDSSDTKNRVGENLFYCTDGCKTACPVYRAVEQRKKFYVPNTSLEVLPEIRKEVLKRDEYKCTKCGASIETTELHCHCILDETDVNSCLTECINCHNITHRDLEIDKLKYEKNKIIEMYENGSTQLKIAKYFGVATSYISVRLRKWGKSNPDVNRFRRFDIDEETVRHLYWSEELHPFQIAKKYGCSKQVIINRMKGWGIPFRTKSQARIGKLNPIYDVGHTKEAKKKMSDSFVNGRTMGFNNHWGIGTYYMTPNQGEVWMRSGWEVKTADYLTFENIDWYYEFEWLDLGEIKYLPDFYIPKLDMYIEVKGRKKGPDLEKVMLAVELGYKVFLWDGEELLKRGIITNSGITEINRKYKNHVVRNIPINEGSEVCLNKN